MTRTRTQVIIVGAGPSGLMLSHILQSQGIDSVVLERSSRKHVLQRIRAGVLEDGTVQMLRQHGLGQRLDAEGSVHNGTGIVWAGHEQFFIDVKKHTGRTMMAYGQTALTEGLYAPRDAAGGVIIEQAADVELHDIDTARPLASYQKDGVTHRVDGDYIAGYDGCDGYHGVSRKSIPASVLKTFEKVYPFGSLGIMSRTPPVPGIIYANHTNGFAMCSQRNPMLSRYYVQCPLTDTPEDWSDDRFWSELTTRTWKVILGPRSNASGVRPACRGGRLICCTVFPPRRKSISDCRRASSIFCVATKTPNARSPCPMSANLTDPEEGNDHERQTHRHHRRVTGIGAQTCALGTNAQPHEALTLRSIILAAGRTVTCN